MGDQDDDFYFVRENTTEEEGAGDRISAISAKKSGNTDKRKDILDPLNRRYNRGKRKVLNYSTWSARGQGQKISTNRLGRRAWWMMTHSPIVPKGGWL